MPANFSDLSLCATTSYLSRNARRNIVLPFSAVRAAYQLVPKYHHTEDVGPFTSLDDLLSMVDWFYLSQQCSDFLFALMDHWRRAGVEQ
ncbi:unnamed protein product [Rhizoctonia solani]|uniref:Uncharacterized protein n=1 Tax=Rhizoctonia solani TaxID=456999 RepID=A0A8H3A5M7_9AGAM|nr:unnamed protein product [Rhizoctonia solani]